MTMATAIRMLAHRLMIRGGDVDLEIIKMLGGVFDDEHETKLPQHLNSIHASENCHCHKARNAGRAEGLREAAMYSQNLCFLDLASELRAKAKEWENK